MGKTKFVFIVNSIQQQRCIKRIEEFIDNGYEVDVYGFSRSKIIPTQPSKFSFNIIGEFENTLSYWKRLQIMFKAIRPIIRKYKGQNVVFYYFLLDVALICRSINPFQKYFYENSDLAHLNMPYPLRSVFDFFDKNTMKHSLVTAVTSEGFLEYYYTKPYPSNIYLITNRINNSILTFPFIPKKESSNGKLRIGFVGVIRYETVYHFINVCTKYCDRVEIHLYGTYSSGDSFASKIKELEELNDNIVYHGTFSNPKDLCQIYSEIDLLLCAYTPKPGVIYAEPNKLYEAIYFRCPIIVNVDTFLGRKVKHMGIGYVINSMDEEEIASFLNNLNREDYKQKIMACGRIPQEDCLNINDSYFNYIRNLC